MVNCYFYMNSPRPRYKADRAHDDFSNEEAITSENEGKSEFLGIFPQQLFCKFRTKTGRLKMDECFPQLVRSGLTKSLITKSRVSQMKANC